MNFDLDDIFKAIGVGATLYFFIHLVSGSYAKTD